MIMTAAAIHLYATYAENPMATTSDLYLTYRTPWGNFPPLMRNDDLGSMEGNPDYAKAKSGDVEAAMCLAASVISKETIEALRAVVERAPGEVRILPVLAEEATGRNKIPLAAAHVFANRLGLKVESRVTQSIRVRRTGSDSSHRLANMPAFTGAVDRAVSYVLVDDTASMGGTLAALRGYVEHHGAKALVALALTAHDNALQLAPDASLIQDIYDKHGSEIESYWHDTFGYSIECLTRAEAGHVFAARSLVALRDRIAQARDAARERADGSGNRQVPGLKAEKAALAFETALTQYLERLPADSVARHKISVFAQEQGFNMREAVASLLTHEKRRGLRVMMFESFKLPEVGGAGDALKHANREMARALRTAPELDAEVAVTTDARCLPAKRERTGF